MSRVALAHAQRLPAGGFVAGSLIGFDVSEGLGQQRFIAERLEPQPGQFPYRCAQNARGQVRVFAALDKQGKAPILHNELLSLCTLRGRPADVFVAGFQAIRCRPPHQQPHPLTVDFGHHAHRIADRTALAQVVVAPEQGVESLMLLASDYSNLQGFTAQ